MDVNDDNEQIIQLLGKVASGEASPDQVLPFLGLGSNTESKIPKKTKKRLSGIRSLGESKARVIQGGELNKGGRPRGVSRAVAERNLAIIMIYISLCDEWEVPQRGRREQVLRMFEERGGRIFSLSRSSITRIVSEWVRYYRESGVGAFDADCTLSRLEWSVLVERFVTDYKKKHKIEKNYINQHL